MNKPTLTHRPENKTVKDIESLYAAGLLNLEPGFQRQSVWSERDRAKLIDSILRRTDPAFGCSILKEPGVCPYFVGV